MEAVAEPRKPASLVFVIDVSGSMGGENRLGLVKRGLRAVVGKLEAKDQVAIVTYGVEAQVKLEPTSGSDPVAIFSAIDALEPEGSTNVQAGVGLGFRVARRAFRPEALNRVVLCADGVGESGVTTSDPVFARIASEAALGITLSTIGFGMGQEKDALMEKLSERGGGTASYADRDEQARRALVENITGKLQLVAKRLEVRVEFEPEEVLRYRLLGYETPFPSSERAGRERKDSGDFGVGESFTGLYEVQLGSDWPIVALVRMTFTPPQGGAERGLDVPVLSSQVRGHFEDASSASRLAFIAATFGEKLRGVYGARNFGYDRLAKGLAQLPPDWRARPDVVELKALIDRAAKIDKRSPSFGRIHPVALNEIGSGPP